MILRALIGLSIILGACTYLPKYSKDMSPKEVTSSHLQKTNSGLHIEYGPNLGASFTNTSGARYFYVHSTAIITNDGTIPIRLQFALSVENEFPSYCGDTNKYKVCLLPERLTPDTATIYNNVVNGQRDFLSLSLEEANIIEKTLNSGEYTVVTIGVLIPKPTKCAAVPRAIFSYDDKELYHMCDQQKNSVFSTKPHLEIGVKLEYYNQRKFIPPEDGCVTIPFGQISYLLD